MSPAVKAPDDTASAQLTSREDPTRSSEEDDAAILRRFGLEPDPVIETYKRDVDRSLLRENLRRTPEERWKILTDATRLAEELRRAGRASR